MLKLTDRITIKSGVKKLLEEAIVNAFPELSLAEVEIKVEYPKDDAHGDYAVAVAAFLSRQIKIDPIKINQRLKEAIEQSNLLVDGLCSNDIQIEIKGIFLNFILKPEFLQKRICKFDDQSHVGAGETVIVEYSQPNIAKPLGAHHLISTVLGQSLHNLFVHLGFKTLPINHLGDWGTQFGKLLSAYKRWGKREVIEKDPIPQLQKLYVRFHDEAEKDPDLEAEGREEFLKLEQGDIENRELWKWFVDVSLKYVQKIYDQLGGITFAKESYMGESFYENKMAAIIKEGKQKGVFMIGQKGSLITEFENEKYPPALIVKSDGATLYATRDLATLKYRLENWQPDYIVYVVDVAQTLHFQQFFEIAHLLGWFEKYKSKPVHIPFGRMSFPGMRMSTRKGNMILLETLIAEAKKHAFELVTEKNPQLSEDERLRIAAIVGVGAIKYSILAQNRNTNVVFTWDKMLSLEGNSAPYLQYTYARACSILEKCAAGGKESGGYVLSAPTEILLARALVKFNEYIVLAAAECRPNLLSNYLYYLAQCFNSFYHAAPVLQAENEAIKNARIELVSCTVAILKKGLDLLGGIEAPARM